MRFVWILVWCTLALLAPARAQAELSLDEIDQVIDIVCAEGEQSVFAPAKNLWRTSCSYEFVIEGAQYWIAYMNTRDLRDPPCPVPKVWCERPERVLLIIVQWPGTGPLPSKEETIVEDAWGITPTSGSFWSNPAKTEFSFRVKEEETAIEPGRPGRGYEYRAHWNMRFEEVLRLVLGRMSPEGS